MTRLANCLKCFESFDLDNKVYSSISKCDNCVRENNALKARIRYSNDPLKIGKEAVTRRKRMLFKGDQIRERNRLSYQGRSAEVSEGYARGMLVRRSSLSATEVPADLVELKRQAIKLKRILKELG